MTMNKNWYAIYTRPKAQKKVSELLTKKGIECFYPLVNVVRQTGDKNKVFFEQFFEGYVFVKTTELQHTFIKEIEHVVNFIYWQNLPAIFKDNEVNMLKHIFTEYYNIKLEKIKVNSNEQMIILEGDVIQDKAILENYERPVKVYLPSMGYALIADVEAPEGKAHTLTSGSRKPQKATI